MIKRFTPIVLMLLLISSSCEDSADHKFDPPKGYKARSGKLIYSKHCTSCHGDDGKLGSGGAKNLTASRMDSTGIVNILEKGKNGMPRQIQYFKSDEEVENIIDHLKSMRK
jgi:mono/diheme cytochrome c family protein